jgi:hypothetical protein
MQNTLTKKELLVLLDIIIFSHVRFHKEEYHTLSGLDDETRVILRQKILEKIIDCFSNNFEEISIEFSKIDIENLSVHLIHFMIYSEYENLGRFKRSDLDSISKKLNLRGWE